MRSFNQPVKKAITAKCYSLTDDKGVVFYVGITIHDLTKRLTAHLNDAKNYVYGTELRPSKKNINKIQRIKNSNYNISINLLQKKVVKNSDQKFALEAKWITYFIKEGVELTNTTKEKMLSLKNRKVKISELA